MTERTVRRWYTRCRTSTGTEHMTSDDDNDDDDDDKLNLHHIYNSKK